MPSMRVPVIPITTPDIADYAIVAAKIATFAVEETKIADFAVSSGKIATFAVSIEKCATGVLTDRIAHDYSSTVFTLDSGAAASIVSFSGV